MVGGNTVLLFSPRSDALPISTSEWTHHGENMVLFIHHSLVYMFMYHT